MATISKTPKSAECCFGTGDFEWQDDQCCTGTDDPRVATKVRIHQKGCFGLRTFKRGGRTPLHGIDRSVNQASTAQASIAQANEAPHHGSNYRGNWSSRPLD